MGRAPNLGLNCHLVKSWLILVACSRILKYSDIRETHTVKGTHLCFVPLPYKTVASCANNEKCTVSQSFLRNISSVYEPGMERLSHIKGNRQAG